MNTHLYKSGNVLIRAAFSVIWIALFLRLKTMCYFDLSKSSKRFSKIFTFCQPGALLKGKHESIFSFAPFPITAINSCNARELLLDLQWGLAAPAWWWRRHSHCRCCCCCELLNIRRRLSINSSRPAPITHWYSLLIYPQSWARSGNCVYCVSVAYCAAAVIGQSLAMWSWH